MRPHDIVLNAMSLTVYIAFQHFTHFAPEFRNRQPFQTVCSFQVPAKQGERRGYRNSGELMQEGVYVFDDIPTTCGEQWIRVD